MFEPSTTSEITRLLRFCWYLMLWSQVKRISKPEVSARWIRSPLESCFQPSSAAESESGAWSDAVGVLPEHVVKQDADHALDALPRNERSVSTLASAAAAGRCFTPAPN